MSRASPWLYVVMLAAVLVPDVTAAQSRAGGPRVSVRQADEEILLAQLRMYDLYREVRGMADGRTRATTAMS